MHTQWPEVTPYVSDGAPLAPGAAHGLSSTVRPLIYGGVALLLGAWMAVFAITVSLGQEPAWPLRNISQYAAHFPAVYIWRAGAISACVLLAQAGWALRRRARWGLVLTVTTLCLMVAGTVSCVEDNSVHTFFAILAFLGLGALQGFAAHAAYRHTGSCGAQRRIASQPHAGRLFWAESLPPRGAAGPQPWLAGPQPWPLAWALGCAGVFTSVAVVFCATGGAMPWLDRVSRACLVSILEWGCTAWSLGFAVHLARTVQ